MAEGEKEFLEYLENCYTGARKTGDISFQTRLGRAIAAFKTDPCEEAEALFTEHFINKYVIGIED